jgi:large subunit ribosomal protein L37Ae
MAKKKEGIGSAGRFGARYGVKLRKKVSMVEAEQRKHHECPSCKQPKVARDAKGIWNCKKCGYKFAGRAYTPGA